MPDFNIGDRVRCVEKYGYGVSIGDTGTIVRCTSWLVFVEWDEFKKGRHDCGGLCKHGYGWNVPYGCIKPVMSDVDFGELPMLDITSLL